MRRFSQTVYGDTAPQMEALALAEASRVYQLPVDQLQVHRNYGIFKNDMSSYLYKDEPEHPAWTTKYHATIDVHPIEPLVGGEWYPDKYKDTTGANRYYSGLLTSLF
jgi:hypothetical protein